MVRGVRMKDMLTGEEWDVRAKVVINATGTVYCPSLHGFNLLCIIHVHVHVHVHVASLASQPCFAACVCTLWKKIMAGLKNYYIYNCTCTVHARVPC